MNALARLLLTQQKRRKLKQAEFAEVLGVSQPFLSKLINGQTGIETELLERIAKETGKTVDEIVRMARNGRR